MAATSDPAPGSVSPKQASFSPRASGGRKARFCSSVPHWKMGRAWRPRWTAIVSRTEESAYSNPSEMMPSER